MNWTKRRMKQARKSSIRVIVLTVRPVESCEAPARCFDCFSLDASVMVSLFSRSVSLISAPLRSARFLRA